MTSTTTASPSSLSASVPVPLRRRPVFYLVGDSLTEWGGVATPTVGWVCELQQEVVRTVDVINRGLSGYNTTWVCEQALPSLTQELREIADRVSLIMVWLGANDAAMADGPSGVMHVDMEQCQANLRAILAAFRDAAPSARILLLTPSVVDEAKISVNQPPMPGADAKSASDPLDRTNATMEMYAKACMAVVKDMPNVHVVNMYEHFMKKYPDPVDRSEIVSDGLHFSARGNHEVFLVVQEKIIELLGPEVLTTMQFPAWRDLVPAATQ